MSILQKLAGPKSKYNKNLPYTYVAEVRELPNDTEITSHYYADTLCGLIDYLREKEIEPGMTHIYGIYRKKEVEINVDHCISQEGSWLERPEICQAMEEKYRETLDKIYLGHVDKGNCEFEDRDREGMGPN